MDLKGRSVLVAGMARSGICAARLLCELGARVSAYDMQEDMPKARETLEGLPIRWCLGKDPLTLARKADIVVISPAVPSDKGWVAEAIDEGINVIGEMELGCLVSRGELIAVTGTNGKTTTTTLIGEIFKNAGRLTYVAGNIGDPITGIANKTQAEDVVVAEVSSFQLETIRGFHPKVSVVLNISEDHLNRHGTMGNYIKLKERVFENQTSGDYAVLNWDDRVTRDMGKRTKCQSIYFSINERPPAGVWVADGQILFSLGRGAARVVCRADEVRIPGAHNLQNALAAAAAACALDVPAPVVRHTLRTFAGVEHRIEPVRELEGVRYINDSKGTNVDAAIKAVEAMDRPTVLLAGGSDKHADFTPFAQAIKKGKIFHVVLFGETAKQIEKSLLLAGYENFSHTHTLKEAVLNARGRCGEGTNVLLSPACASFDQFTDYEERGRVFKQIVREL